MTKIISVIGHKNAGKTTLVCALSHEFKRQKRRVATIKHATTPLEVDKDGTDSWRHFHEGMADGVIVASPELRVSFERRTDQAGPEDLARQYFSDMHIVIAEGFKRHPLPKIEVHRKELGKPPLYDPAAPNASEWIAIVTDDHKYHAPCRVLHFTDTMWLTVLTALVMENAKPLTP